VTSGGEYVVAKIVRTNRLKEVAAMNAT